MSTISPAALKQLKAKGFTLQFETVGPAGSGKTTAALARAKELHAQGYETVIEDEIPDKQGSRVRVWGKRDALSR